MLYLARFNTLAKKKRLFLVYFYYRSRFTAVSSWEIIRKTPKDLVWVWRRQQLVSRGELIRDAPPPPSKSSPGPAPCHRWPFPEPEHSQPPPPASPTSAGSEVLLLHSVWLLRAICILCTRNLVIGIMRKQYTYWVHNIMKLWSWVWLLWQYAIIWLLSSLHILPVALDAVNLLLGHCLAVFLFSDVIIMAKLLKNLLARAKWIWLKIAQWPKRRLMVSRATWRMWCCGGMAATILHIATIPNSYTAHWISQYVYCLHNM